MPMSLVAKSRLRTVSACTCAADQFVRLARQFQSEIRVHDHGNECDGKSILDLMTLAAECGTRLELAANGADADAAVAALAGLVSARFYENEDRDSTEAQPGTEPTR